MILYYIREWWEASGDMYTHPVNSPRTLELFNLLHFKGRWKFKVCVLYHTHWLCVASNHIPDGNFSPVIANIYRGWLLLFHFVYAIGYPWAISWPCEFITQSGLDISCVGPCAPRRGVRSVLCTLDLMTSVTFLADLRTDTSLCHRSEIFGLNKFILLYFPSLLIAISLILYVKSFLKKLTPKNSQSI